MLLEIVLRISVVDLDEYVMKGMFEQFKTDLLKGITDSPANCVEIMRGAFGKDYIISPILYNELSNMFEKAIKSLLEEGRITEFNRIKDNKNMYSVFTTIYFKVNK